MLLTVPSKGMMMSKFHPDDVVLRNTAPSNDGFENMCVGALGIVRGCTRTHAIIDDGFLDTTWNTTAFFSVPVEHLDLLEANDNEEA
jgi:hypothetical protein